VKHVLPWLAWWLVLFWLWFLLVGEWNRQEVIAAAIAATIAATVAEFARTRAGFGARVPLRAVADLPEALGMVIVDFGILAWALVTSAARRRVVRGKFVARKLEGGAVTPRGVGPRAWTVLVACYSPNAYVIDVDPEEQSVLLHDLVPHRASERPV
jgi:hypothetical protein